MTFFVLWVYDVFPLHFRFGLGSDELALPEFHLSNVAAKKETLGCKKGFGWTWTSNLFELTNLTSDLNLRT